MKKIIYVILLTAVLLTWSNKPVFATAFTLVPPSGQLSRGQEVPFTINIDTQGATVTSLQTGMTYDTAYLQYVSAVPGSAMNTVTTDTSLGSGRILLTGTNNTGYMGTGVFATVTFRIIADQPGTTEICTLWAPSITPTTPPAVSCNTGCTTTSQCPASMTCYIASGQTTGVCRNTSCTDRPDCVCLQPTAYYQPTSPPVATALPQTGNDTPQNNGVMIGGAFILIAGSVLLISRMSQFSHPHKKHTAKK